MPRTARGGSGKEKRNGKEKENGNGNGNRHGAAAANRNGDGCWSDRGEARGQEPEPRLGPELGPGGPWAISAGMTAAAAIPACGTAASTRARYIFRLAHAVCRAAGIGGAVAYEAARLALSKPAKRELLVHVLAAAMYTSTRAGGPYFRFPWEWEEAIRSMALTRPGRPAAGGHRLVSMWTVCRYAREVYGPLEWGKWYWTRLKLLVPKKAVMRASLLIEEPRTLGEAVEAVLAADYDHQLTEEDFKKIGAPQRGDAESANSATINKINMRPFHTLYRLCDELGLPWEVEERVAKGIRQRLEAGGSLGSVGAAALLYAAANSSEEARTYRLPVEWLRALKKAGISMPIPDVLYEARRKYGQSFVEQCLGPSSRGCAGGGGDGGYQANSSANTIKGLRQRMRAETELEKCAYRIGSAIGLPEAKVWALVRFVASQRCSSHPVT
ncbi:MAG: hypothetical protein ACP5KV_03755, partial [Candidatus Methanomethylicaceae archaeon]